MRGCRVYEVVVVLEVRSFEKWLSRPLFFFCIGVVDILDIKWESLIQNNIEKPAVPRAVMNRFSASAIFHRIGVSRAFAGDDLWSQVKNFCQKQLDVESAIKTEEHNSLYKYMPSGYLVMFLSKNICVFAPIEFSLAGR